MSRIRSIHPGIWTDEAFMSLSAHARLLIIGIWQEAFDDGVFDWKPLTIKARIFPVDAVDMNALMAELVEQNFIRQEEYEGRKVGLVRNFQAYQRPKKPNSSGAMKPEWRNYLGSRADGSEPVENQDGTGGEKSPQMEDGGWRMEDEEQSPPPVQEPAKQRGAREIFDDLLEAYPDNPSSSDEKAWAVFKAMKQADQEATVIAAQRFAKWSAQDAESRGRTIEAQCRYSPHLSNWLSDGTWKNAAKLAIKGEGSPDMMVIHKGSPEFIAVEKLRGKPIPVFSESGAITITRAELQRATAAVH